MILFSGAAFSAEAPPDCSRAAGSLPDEHRAAGVPDSSIPIEHIIVLMQENRSFDHYYGRLNTHGYEGDVDGIDLSRGERDSNQKWITPFRIKEFCSDDPNHEWNDMHSSWNGGLNDGFVKQSGEKALSYLDESDLNYYYALANEFAIGDRYFSSVLGPTYPNRFFLYAATAFGNVKNEIPSNLDGYTQKTIFEMLNAHGVTWRYYFTDLPVIFNFRRMFLENLDKVFFSGQFEKDLRSGNLPQVVFMDSSIIFGDEHPGYDFQVGERRTAKKIQHLMESQYWPKSVMIVTYDEAGGFADHVPPPPACEPDEIQPDLKDGDYPARYDRYGFRVPVTVVSPYAKHHYVSHQIYDHASVLKFIETKFNLPALSRRDANANDMLDFFDFQKPRFELPSLPEPILDETQHSECMEKFISR